MITILSLSQPSAGSFIVELSDGRKLHSSLDVVTDFRLFSGKELCEEEFDAFLSANNRAITRQTALSMLSRRPMMSRKELKDKLCHHSVPDDDADACCDWLQSRGFLDDEATAAAVARHYAGKGYGNGRIEIEFLKRGIDRSLWKEALANLPENSDSIERYIRNHLKDPEDPRQVDKLVMALSRRGFSWSEIHEALANYMGAVYE